MLPFQRRILLDLTPAPAIDTDAQAALPGSSLDDNDNNEDPYGSAADDGDGLIVLAHGLGLFRLIALVAQAHASPSALVLLIGTPTHSLPALAALVRERTGDAASFTIVDSNVLAKDRVALYRIGGL